MDSRAAGPGCLFFALKGERTDGHDFLGAVAAAGADTFVAGSAIFGAKDYRATIAAMRAEIAKSGS